MPRRGARRSGKGFVRPILIATLVLGFVGVGGAPIEAWMGQAFYPTLLLVLIVASLGIPIPEDVPLIAAGVLLKTHPDVGTWAGTLFIAMLGIMSGDLVLYYAGKKWGSDVVTHRFVRWLITPRRFRKTSASFRRYGMWYCFFGRFIMGVRSVMCITAGATRFPYWKFFIADCCGALLSVPFFVWLGYVCADMIPTLEAYLTGVKGALFLAVLLVVIGLVVTYRVRSYRRGRAELGETGDFSDKPRAAAVERAPTPKGPSVGKALRNRAVQAKT